MNRLALMATAFVLCLAAPDNFAAAQSHALPPPVGGITFEQVIELSHSGLSDATIIAQIRKRPQPFNLTADQLLQLKNAQVSDAVIEAMSDADSEPSPYVAPGSGSTHDLRLPKEIGVYAKVGGAWLELEPEIVNWKTGGVVKSTATLGIVKGDINGHINSPSSPNRIALPMEFVIVAPEGEAITEYQLLRLHQHSGNREFRTVTGGVFHASGGATRDLMPFDSKKLHTRTYEVNLPAGAGVGEYGFLPPGSYASSNLASTGKIYSFRVTE